MIAGAKSSLAASYSAFTSAGRDRLALHPVTVTLTAFGDERQPAVGGGEAQHGIQLRGLQVDCPTARAPARTSCAVYASTCEGRRFGHPDRSDALLDGVALGARGTSSPSFGVSTLAAR